MVISKYDIIFLGKTPGYKHGDWFKPHELDYLANSWKPKSCVNQSKCGTFLGKIPQLNVDQSTALCRANFPGKIPQG